MAVLVPVNVGVGLVGSIGRSLVNGVTMAIAICRGSVSV